MSEDRAQLIGLVGYFVFLAIVAYSIHSTLRQLAARPAAPVLRLVPFAGSDRKPGRKPKK